MTDSGWETKFKILFSYVKCDCETEFIIELKRLDLSSDAPLDQKFRWIIVNESIIEPLTFVSMEKTDSIQYRKFVEGEFHFNSEDGEFFYNSTPSQKILYKFCNSSSIEANVLSRIKNFLEN